MPIIETDAKSNWYEKKTKAFKIILDSKIQVGSLDSKYLQEKTGNNVQKIRYCFLLFDLQSLDNSSNDIIYRKLLTVYDVHETIYNNQIRSLKNKKSILSVTNFLQWRKAWLFFYQHTMSLIGNQIIRRISERERIYLKRWQDFTSAKVRLVSKTKFNKEYKKIK